jgi:hypothetical protein
LHKHFDRRCADLARLASPSINSQPLHKISNFTARLNMVTQRRAAILNRRTQCFDNGRSQPHGATASDCCRFATG